MLIYRHSLVITTIVVALSRLITGLTTIPPQLDEFLSKHPISTTRASVPRSPTLSVNRILHSQPERFQASRDRCPTSCSESGDNPSNWTVYHSVDRLTWCNQTMLLDFSISNSVADPDTHKSIRACTSDNNSNSPSSSDVSCPKSRHGSINKVYTSLHMNSEGTAGTPSDSDLGAAITQLERYQHGYCDETIAFASSGSAVVGLYAGSEIQRQGLTSSVLKDFTAALKNNATSETILVQLCGESRSARYSLGVISNAKGDLAAVQNAVQSWKNGDCVADCSEKSQWREITFTEPIIDHSNNNSTRINGSTASNSCALQAQTTCSTTSIHGGDTCTSLAAECKITLAQFKKYNPKLCSAPLMQGQHVCCSAGKLPDFTPKPFSNGTCAMHLVKHGDTCHALAASHGIKTSDIEMFNNNTWGWMGCRLQAGYYICLSKGDPPMPAPIANAVCGPIVPGTKAPPAGTNLSTLNECPLNACCDIWGQCGTTDEFCTITKSPTGAPGTAAKGTNGCISNCGTKIVESDAPSHFMKVGYFEGYDESRPCLSSSVASIADSDYTHVHLGFAGLTPDFKVNVTDISDQFNAFMSLEVGFKKILSFGGWGFSTSPATYNIFREMVKLENRVKAASNIVDFVKKYNLDGVDIDWEYPGEPDIKPIPPGSKEEGVDYYLFLMALGAKLRSEVPGATLSIAAPASYWYLKQFPIDAIAEVVDYIIYMTYDLHGQWDSGNSNSQIGCPGGNCLRSAVNLTETLNSLSMITKAGVPSNKLVIGVTSYGRSFQMTTPGCYKEMCTYTGGPNDSGAYPGTCTGTAGYLANAEISYANETGAKVLHAFDMDSYSDILVFDSTQWVAWMRDENKITRTKLYKGMNFAGTTDWAVDLQGTADTVKSECKSLKATDTFFPKCTPVSPNTGCIAGTGKGDYKDLCEFSCRYNYCPEPFCTCTATAKIIPEPIQTPTAVCPVDRLDSSFIGLCDFACKHGHCPSNYCTTKTKTNSIGIEFCGNIPWLGQRQFKNLKPDASCEQVGDYGIIQESMWDRINATDSLKKYLDHYKGVDFVLDLANPLGVGQSYGPCGRLDTDRCQQENCLRTTPGTGWKYYTLMSISNLNAVMHTLYLATGNMPSTFTARGSNMISDFTWPPPPDMSLFWTEFLTAISTMIIVVTTATGDVPVTAAGAFLGGVVTEGLNAMSQPDNQAQNNLSIEASNWANSLRSEYTKMWANTIDRGDDSMLKLFDHGAFLAQQDIPIVSPAADNQITLDQVEKYVLNIWDAAVVNKLWNQDTVFLYCYPMSKDTFDSNKDKYNANLQAWVDQDSGYGCYLQGISDYNVIFKYGDPPGYDLLGTDYSYNFTVSDVIQSSYASFVEGGFNYTAPVAKNIEQVLELTANDIANSSKLWTMAGTFNLPICDPSDTWSIDDFYDYIDYNGYGDVASVCGCQDYTDKNGVKFSEFISIGSGCSCGSVAECCVIEGGVSVCPDELKGGVLSWSPRNSTNSSAPSGV